MSIIQIQALFYTIYIYILHNLVFNINLYIWKFMKKNVFIAFMNKNIFLIQIHGTCFRWSNAHFRNTLYTMKYLHQSIAAE